MLDKILEIRGVDESFLYPENPHHSATLFKNYDKASKLLINHLQKGSKIFISYDVDIDGFVSGTLVYKYLEIIASNFDIEVKAMYHRKSKGHGVKHQIDQIDSDEGLVIIVDSSSNDFEDSKKLKEKGLDVLILDHHELDKPNEFAVIINPMQAGCNYPNKNMVGASVVYKFLEEFNDSYIGADIEHLEDLVGLGLIADVASMKEEENRYFVNQLITNTNNYGLASLMVATNADTANLNTQSFSYGVAPLLNACLRVGREDLVFNLFLENNGVQMEVLVHEILQQKEIQKEIVDNVLENIDIIETKHAVITQSSEDISGLTGLIANEMTKRYKKHAFVLNDDIMPKGSSRSYQNAKTLDHISLGKSVATANGHQQAYGITLNELDKFVDEVDMLLRKVKKSTDSDYDIEVSKITKQDVDSLKVINRITGKDFPQVKIKISLSALEGKVLGKTGNTYKIATLDGIDILDFNYSEDKYEIGYFDDVVVIGSPNINVWQHPRTKKVTETLQIIADSIEVT